MPPWFPLRFPTFGGGGGGGGGGRVELRVGLNFYVAEGDFARNRLSIEVAQPIRQSLHGPQLQQGFSLNIGWQYAWRFLR